MKTILILSVGGAHQPIVTSIKEHQPERVYFLCSDDAGKLRGSYTQVLGEGKVLKSRPDLDKPDLPNIVTLANLPPEHFEVHKIARFDDLNDCYLEALKLIEKGRKEWPGARLLVDYTGGTKSMTAGLTSAALDDGQCDISLVVGRREDLVKVKDHTEFARPVRVWDLQVVRRMQAARELLSRYDYAAAEKLLRQAAARFASERTLETLQRGIALCRAFDAWDKFDHATVRDLLHPYRGEVLPQWRFLRCLLEEDHSHGLEGVEDLLLNAQRRAAQGRFDDAVGRVYRALEMTAQLWLKLKYGIDTGDVDPALTPETQRATLERHRKEQPGKTGKIEIGLRAAWDLLAAFPGDPLGQRYACESKAILNFLTVRNSSLLAHGLRPVRAEDYERHVPRVSGLLEECIARAIEARQMAREVSPAQLPTDFLTLEG
jgi:hypothetical protein